MPASPVPDPTTTSHLVTALGVMGTIILSLIGVLYHNDKETKKRLQDQLDAGVEEFTDHLVELEKLKKDIDSIRIWVKAIEKELDDFEIKRLKDHEQFLVMKDQHKRNHGEDI